MDMGATALRQQGANVEEYVGVLEQIDWDFLYEAQLLPLVPVAFEIRR